MDSEEEEDIHVAVTNGDVDKVIAIVRTIQDIDERESEEKTALYLAAQFGYEDIAEVLLKHGATVDSRCNTGYTPLHISVENDFIRCVCLLLKHKADVNARESEWGSTPLVIASFWGHFEIAEVLVKNGADASISAYFDYSPLGCASIKGHAKIVNLLLNHKTGVDIEAKTNNGYSPLMHAIANSHQEVIDLLLNFGANPNTSDVDGVTLAHILASKGNIEQMKKLLKPNNGDKTFNFLQLNVTDNNGDTPLHKAVENNHLDMLKILVQCKQVDINSQNKKGYTILHTAAEKGYQNTIRYIQNIGIDATLESKDGDTATDIAYIHDHMYVVEVLKLQQKLSPNIEDRKHNVYAELAIQKANRNDSNKSKNAPVPMPRSNSNTSNRSVDQRQYAKADPTSLQSMSPKVPLRNKNFDFAKPIIHPRASMISNNCKVKSYMDMDQMSLTDTNEDYLEVIYPSGNGDMQTPVYSDATAIQQQYRQEDGNKPRVIPVTGKYEKPNTSPNLNQGREPLSPMRSPAQTVASAKLQVKENTLKNDSPSGNYKKTKNPFKRLFMKKSLEPVMTKTDKDSLKETDTTIRELNVSFKTKEMVSDVYIEFQKLILGELIGRGNFGRVYVGNLKTDKGFENIAVKTTKFRANETDEIESFLQEGLLMKGFKHPHVLGLIGVTFDQEGNPYVLLPLMTLGNLRNFIREPRRDLTVQNLLQLSLQVAKGMQYLSFQKFVHRDLACRNCMIDQVNAEAPIVVKVGDFGLSRDLHKQAYYKINDHSLALPVRWMAIESLENNIFKLKSDVWSFGVLLWELMTRGSTPYDNIENWDLKKYLRKGHRLAKPNYCPDEIYGLMQTCWNTVPDRRPDFSSIVTDIEDFLYKGSKSYQSKLCPDEAQRMK